jgi:hypothetical protein
MIKIINRILNAPVNKKTIFIFAVITILVIALLIAMAVNFSTNNQDEFYYEIIG